MFYLVAAFSSCGWAVPPVSFGHCSVVSAYSVHDSKSVWAVNVGFRNWNRNCCLELFFYKSFLLRLPVIGTHICVLLLQCLGPRLDVIVLHRCEEAVFCFFTMSRGGFQPSLHTPGVQIFFCGAFFFRFCACRRGAVLTCFHAALHAPLFQLWHVQTNAVWVPFQGVCKQRADVLEQI